MARGPGQPKVRILRVVTGALADGVRRSPIILPMAAFAFAGPWIAAFQLVPALGGRSEWVALVLVGSIFLLGAAMQSLLVELAGADLKPARARWTLDPWLVTRRLAVDLVISLISLVLVTVAALGGAVVVGVAQTIAFHANDDTPWWAVGGGVLGAVLVTLFLSRWAVALPAAHVEAVGVVGALQRSTELTHGQRWRVSGIQALYVAAWPALLFSLIYISDILSRRYHQRGDSHIEQGVIAGVFMLLGVLAALEALGKVRLYRELATVEGQVGQANLADVFG